MRLTLASEFGNPPSRLLDPPSATKYLDIENYFFFNFYLSYFAKMLLKTCFVHWMGFFL